LPIFFKDWWLDCVCGPNRWQVISYLEDPNIVAVLPYFIKSKGPFTYVTMPVLTKFMGPYFLKSFSEKKQQSILNRLLAALPGFHGFVQTMHYQITNWLPYRWQGFSQTAYYSYQLTNIQQLDLVWKHMDSDYRNNKIPKAESVASVHQDLTFDLFLKIINQPFDRQQISIPYRDEDLEKIYKLVYERGCGKSLYAQDQAGNILAAILLVWDQDRCYLLLAGENDFARKHGVGILTIWHGIQYAAENLQLTDFDFLGGMDENLERTRRQFGATQIPYFLVEKNRGIFALLKNLSTFFSKK
jgi:hypothetical protein